MPQSRRELAYLHNSRGAALTVMAQVQAERRRFVGVCRHVARLPRPHPVVQHQRAERQRLRRGKVHPRSSVLHHVPAFEIAAPQQLCATAWLLVPWRLIWNRLEACNKQVAGPPM